MTLSARLIERLEAREISQIELARRLGLSQQAINRMVRGKVRTTSHLHRIARELGTTPEYLIGETDDPDAGAPAPPEPPRVKIIVTPSALPSEVALTDVFRELLIHSRHKDADGLARELVKQLPDLIRRAARASAQ
jgi:transcriptional regulator with XRE-family HTH domain